MNDKITRKKKKALYSIGEVRDLLGVHIETLRRMDKQGKLKAVRLGPKGMRRYRKADVEKLINYPNISNE